jgi:hypothetical protein
MQNLRFDEAYWLNLRFRGAFPRGFQGPLTEALNASLHLQREG